MTKFRGEEDPWKKLDSGRGQSEAEVSRGAWIVHICSSRARANPLVLRLLYPLFLSEHPQNPPA